MQIEIRSSLKYNGACLTSIIFLRRTKKKNKKINKNKIKVNERGKITPLLSVLFKWKIYNRFDGD